MDSNDHRKKLKRKNITVALIVVGLCVLFYFVTVVRIGAAP